MNGNRKRGMGKERNKTYCQGNIIFNYILFDILAWIVQHNTTQRNATHKQKHFKAQTKLNQSIKTIR